MGMNLHCDETDLWQTPTYITDMCMSLDDNGNPDGGMEGVRKRYLMWVRGRLNGAWRTKEDYEIEEMIVQEHCELVMALENPQFYIA